MFFVAAQPARDSTRVNRLWLMLFSFLVALSPINIDRSLSLSEVPLPTLNAAANSPTGRAIEKLESSPLGVVIMLVPNRLAGRSVDSLDIRRGSLGLGLTVGLVTFVVTIATVGPVTETYCRGKELTWAAHTGLVPVDINLCAGACVHQLRGTFQPPSAVAVITLQLRIEPGAPY